jgi:hypothetical protein
MRDERRRAFFFHPSSLIPHPFLNDLPFVPELVNRLEHLLRRHLGRVVTNLEQVFFQIDGDLPDAWKP